MTFGSKAKARTPLKFTTSNTPMKRPATGCRTPTTGRKKVKGNHFTPSRSTARVNLTNRSPSKFKKHIIKAKRSNLSMLSSKTV